MTEDGPTRILLTTDAVGGVWQYTLSLAEGLNEAGCECTVASLGPRPDAGQRLAALAAGVELVETDLPLDWTAPDLASLAAAAADLRLLARDADLVHLHTPALAPFDWDVPTVAVAHSCVGTWWAAVRGGPMPPDLAWRAEQMRLGLRAADCTIVPSQSFAAALRTVYGGEGRLAVVPNGHDEVVAPAMPRDGAVLGVGRLWDPGKNVQTLDAAAARVPCAVEAAGPVNGPGGARFNADHLALLGVLDGAALRVRRRRAALFAAPSVYEPFGLAVLEAASCATPLVLSDIPTFRELWDGAAMFVPARDVQGWAYAISALMADPVRRDELGALAAARAARFNRRALIQATRAIHRRVALLPS
jgi:glycosyltransferase involved in cell wall biosynthesis